MGSTDVVKSRKVNHPQVPRWRSCQRLNAGTPRPFGVQAGPPSNELSPTILLTSFSRTRQSQCYHGAVTMAAKRLIKELDAYNRDPSPAISSLEPLSDEDLFHLTALLRGPEETAYEGISFTRYGEAP